MGKEATQFKEGNPGKPKGAVNKVNRLVKDLVSDVFNKLQESQDAKKVKADLYSWAKENPKDFYQIAAKLIPVQMEHSGDVTGIVRVIQIPDNGRNNKTTAGVSRESLN